MLWLEDLTFLQFEFKLREYLKTHHYQEHKVTNLNISDFYAVYKESGYGFGAGEHSWFFAYDTLYSTGIEDRNDTVDLPSNDPYQEFLFANARAPFITDGKVYLGHAEHSPIDPKPHGAPFVCLDAETGELIWESDSLFRQTHWGGREG